MAVAHVLHVAAPEQLMMNFYREFRSKDITFHFAVAKGGKPFRFLSDPCFNGEVYSLTPLSESKLLWMKELRALVKSGHFTHVHLHAGWHNVLGLLALRGLDVERIAHAHSVYPARNLLTRVRNSVVRTLISLLTRTRLACSAEAGQQMFGHNFSTLPNVVDYETFRFNSSRREAIRRTLGIDSKHQVLGHVGQFIPAKNHVFLIETLALLATDNPHVRLLLVGDFGETSPLVFERANELGVNDRLIVLNETLDVASVFCAMDLFVFPSLFEGFGMVLLEAQISGLPVIFTEHLPHDAVISESTFALSLNRGPQSWASACSKLLQKPKKDRSAQYLSLDRSFDARARAQQLEDFYLAYTKHSPIRK